MRLPLNLRLLTDVPRYKRVMDAYLEQGGLDPNIYRRAGEGEDDMIKWTYKFTYDFLGNFFSYVHQVVEKNGVYRAYIFAEVEVGNVPKDINPEYYDTVFTSNTSIRTACRLYVKPNRALALGFHMPADALSDDYLIELLAQLKLKGKRLFEENQSYELLKMIEVESDNLPKYTT